MKNITIVLESFFDDPELKRPDQIINTNTQFVRELFNHNKINQELFEEEIIFVNNASDEDLKKEIESKKSKFFMIKNTVILEILQEMKCRERVA